MDARFHINMDFVSAVQVLRRLAEGAILAASPRECVARHEGLHRWINSNKGSGFALVAAGKAAVEMCRGVPPDLLHPQVAALSAPPDQVEWASASLLSLPVLPADHPLPSDRNVAAARAALAVAHQAGSLAIPLLVLLSGGASAMLCLPVDGLSLTDLQDLTRELLSSGADIQEINCIRKHCERLKGGQLARAAKPSAVMTYAMSDVVGNHLDAIGSGPTVADPTTYAQAIDIMRRRKLGDKIPRVMAHLEAGLRGERPETPKPGSFGAQDIRAEIIMDGPTAALATADLARMLNLPVEHVGLSMQGEAAEQAAEFCHELRRSRDRRGRGTCLIWSGETIVTLDGVDAAAVGGRNHEAALTAAIILEKHSNMAVAMFATDGLDGNTGAAGAIVTSQTAASARSIGLDAAEFLSRHNSGTFFKLAGRAVEPLAFGATGTNVNDLWIGLAW